MDNVLDHMSHCTLVETLSGDVGIVVETDWRREHHYLDRDLWVLILVKSESVWMRASDVQSWSENA